jgi:uncharacterized membrane protein YhhN
VSGLVASDFQDFKGGRFALKPLAASAFIWLAVLLDAPQSNYGQWLLFGLVLCAAGDVLLMFEAEAAFLAGLVAFLCGHLLYAVAFTQLPLNTMAIAIACLPALALIVLVLFWLRPVFTGTYASGGSRLYHCYRRYAGIRRWHLGERRVAADFVWRLGLCFF